MPTQDIDQAESNKTEQGEQMSRRDFLAGLKKWSKVAIGAALLSGPLSMVKDSEAGAWINRRGGGGGGWGNRRGGGGGAWGNGRGTWANGSRGGWVNRRGGAGWVNRY